MTQQEIREHVLNRERTPNGTIGRGTTERWPDGYGETIRDVQPVALAFIKAVHAQPCACRFCA